MLLGGEWRVIKQYKFFSLLMLVLVLLWEKKRRGFEQVGFFYGHKGTSKQARKPVKCNLASQETDVKDSVFIFLGIFFGLIYRFRISFLTCCPFL